MSDLSSKVRLEAEVVAKGVDELSRDIAVLAEQVPDLRREFDKLEAQAAKLSKTAGGVASKLGAQATATSKATSAAEAGTIAMAKAMQAQLGLNAAGTKAVPLYGQQAQGMRVAADAAAFATEASKKATSSIISTRYALYDVATTAGIAGAAFLALTAITTSFAASYESSFTDVQRTTLASGAQLESIRQQLLGLARDIPLAFSDVTSIASLGAQLNIADADLQAFTATVARFSAASNVSVDMSGMAFGALGQLLDVSAADYERLGSAIAYVGVNSVATEAEILAMAQRLAASAANAGFTAQEVVALSGALSSLRVAPERAQGVMEVYFRTLNTAIADGGARLDAFASIAGVATAEVGRLVQSDPTSFFRQLAAGLGSLDPVSLTKALQDLGLSGIRAGEVFTRVSNNLEVFDKSLNDSNSAYQDGSFLAQVYATRVEDIAAKFQILQNSLGELAATAGQALLPVIGPILDGLSAAVQFLSDLLATPAGQWLSGVAVAGGTVAGALLAIVSTGALAIASLFALRTAIAGLGWDAAMSGARGIIAALFGVGTASAGATAGLHTFKVALASTGIGLAVLALGALAAAFIQAGQDSTKAFENFVGSTAGLSDAIKADTAEYRAALESGNTAVAASFTEVTLANQENKDAFDENAQAAANAATILGVDVPRSWTDATGAIHNNSAALGENTLAWLKNQLIQSDAFLALSKNTGFTDFFADSGASFDEVVRVAATQGRSGLESYFENLISAYSVGSAKFSDFVGRGLFLGVNDMIRGLAGYQGQIQLLGLQDAISGVNETADAGELTDYTSALDDLGSSGGGAAAQVRTLVDYANDLAKVWDRAFDIRFGGQQGLDAITSGWIKMRDAIEAANVEIADHQAKMQSLTADRAIKEYWLSVAENYGDVLRAGELRAELAELDADLVTTSKKLTKAQDKQSKSLVGNTEGAIENRAEILTLVSGYQSYLKALASSGLSQDALRVKATQLKADFMAQATQLGYNASELGDYAAAFDDLTVAINGVPTNITVTANTDPATQALNEFMASARATAGGGVIVPARVEITKPTFEQWMRASAGGISASAPQAAWEQYIAQARGRYNQLFGYRDGGYTGDVGTSQVAGVVHGKEFVWSAPAVRNVGVQNLAYAHNMAKRGKGFQSGGYAGSMGGGLGIPGYSQWSPQDRALIQELIRAVNDKPVLTAGAVGAAASAVAVNGSSRRSA